MTAFPLLAEDGIVDPLAVELAASGYRPVALTPTERDLAAIRILAAGGGSATIAARLGISERAARTLAVRLRAQDRGAAEVWSGACAPGGYVCAHPEPGMPEGICGWPAESEPCPEHGTRGAA
jgi:DNA-binding CsgD family transcriptional regulator